MDRGGKLAAWLALAFAVSHLQTSIYSFITHILRFLLCWYFRLRKLKRFRRCFSICYVGSINLFNLMGFYRFWIGWRTNLKRNQSCNSTSRSCRTTPSSVFCSRYKWKMGVLCENRTSFLDCSDCKTEKFRNDRGSDHLPKFHSLFDTKKELYIICNCFFCWTVSLHIFPC